MIGNEKPGLRLQKVIADSGVTSRRKAEELIQEGRVKVNDEVVTEMGIKVDPYKDIIQVDGEVIEADTAEKLYIVMHKPRGVMCTVDDPEGRQTVIDLCKGIQARIFPVGRLDYLSEGLLLLTNDGDLANKIMHPRYEVIKTYEVKVFGLVNDYILQKLRAGVVSQGEKLKPRSVRVVQQLPKKTWIEIRLGEGRNREIRRLCEEIGLTIDKLKRVAIGGLSIRNLKPGSFDLVSYKKLCDLIGLGKKDIRYVSSRKTLGENRRRRKSKQSGLNADDSAFMKYRKKYYQQTMKNTKKVESGNK